MKNTTKTTPATGTQTKVAKAPKTTPKAQVTKVVITSSTEAVRYLRDYMREANFSATGSHYTVGTSKARWTSVAQMVSWYRTNKNLAIDAGWMGRSLNAAITAGMAVSRSTAKAPTGKTVSIYRNSR